MSDWCFESHTVCFSSFLAPKRLEESRLLALRRTSAVRIQSVFRQLQARQMALHKRKQLCRAILTPSLGRRRLRKPSLLFSKEQQLASIALQSGRVGMCSCFSRSANCQRSRRRGKCFYRLAQAQRENIQSSRLAFKERLELHLRHLAATRIQACVSRLEL